eukprot:s2351_g9.t1
MQRFEELSSALRLRARRSARAADNKPAKVPIGESSTKTFRILCFHGFVQNGDILKQKTGSLRRAMKGCEFIFLDAPHSAAGAFQEETAAEKNEAAASEGVGPRGWWVSEENARKQQGEAWVRPAQSYACVGFEEGMACAREAAVRVCEDGQQIHGVLAFSQGCAAGTPGCHMPSPGSATGRRTSALQCESGNPRWWLRATRSGNRKSLSIISAAA